MDPLMPDELRRLQLDGELHVVETERGYVLTDGYLTDWLDQVDARPHKFVCDGTFRLTSEELAKVCDFIDGRL